MLAPDTCTWRESGHSCPLINRRKQHGTLCVHSMRWKYIFMLKRHIQIFRIIIFIFYCKSTHIIFYKSCIRWAFAFAMSDPLHTTAWLKRNIRHKKITEKKKRETAWMYRRRHRLHEIHPNGGYLIEISKLNCCRCADIRITKIINSISWPDLIAYSSWLQFLHGKSMHSFPVSS